MLLLDTRTHVWGWSYFYWFVDFNESIHYTTRTGVRLYVSIRGQRGGSRTCFLSDNKKPNYYNRCSGHWTRRCRPERLPQDVRPCCVSAPQSPKGQTTGTGTGEKKFLITTLVTVGSRKSDLVTVIVPVIPQYVSWCDLCLLSDDLFESIPLELDDPSPFISSGNFRMTRSSTSNHRPVTIHQKKRELINQQLISSKYGQKDQYTVNGILFLVNKGGKYDLEIFDILLENKSHLLEIVFKVILYLFWY